MKFGILLSFFFVFLNGSIAQQNVQLTCINVAESPEGRKQCKNVVLTDEPSRSKNWGEIVKFGDASGNDKNEFEKIPHGIYDFKPKVKSLTFQYVPLKTLQAGDAKGLDKLYIHYSSISTLDANIFSQSLKLTDLFIANSKISEIHKDAFKGLTSLEELALYVNQIETLPEEVFKDLTSLTTLNLAGNKIKVFPSNILKPLVNMKSLDATNNDLTSFDATALGLSPKVGINIYLSENAITSADFSKLRRFKNHIDLSDNKMERLPADILNISIEDSCEIILKDNPIKSVDPELFEKNPNYFLDLRYTECFKGEEKFIKLENHKRLLKACYKNFVASR